MSTLSGMAATEYEAVPAVDADAEAAHLGTVVMKFGGTSVGDPEKLKRVAARLVAARDEGHRVVGVLSAMGRTTDELLDLAHQISDTPHPRELDMLVSVGERISCALAAMVIHDLGHEAISLTGSQAGIVTDTVHGKAKIVEVRARRIHEALDEGTIVLVAGFQGVSTAFEVTTLGRGGSDTTAVALAAALGADHCEIYTDVLGVYSADPRVVPDARQLTHVSFDEMLEMASSGAGVMATRSIEVARSHNVRLHVRSSFEEGDGTWIQQEDEEMLEKALISGVVHQREETVYRVEGTTAARLFGALAEASVNVDTIVQTNAEIVFSAPVEDRADASRTLDALGVSWTLARRPRQGQPRRRGDEEPPGRRREDVRHARAGRHRGLDRLHLADQDRLPRSLQRRRPGRPAPARGVRAWVAATRASASSAPPARSGRSRWSSCASAATATCACSRPRAPPGSSSAERRSRRRRRKCSLPATSISASSRSAPRPAASSFRTPSAAAPSASTSRLPTGSSPGSRSSCPEVNGIRAAEHQGIVANPNCCAIPLTCALKPLHDAVGLERIRVATYQSVSGAGAQAMERLRAQTPEENDLRMDWSFDGVEFDEEEKLREETRKILELPALPVSATCVRVPILVGHAEAVWIETKEPLSAEQATSILGGAPGLRLEQFPTPGGAAGGDDVLVGRIRKDPTIENGLALFIVGDNLRKGAALNAIQIAELLLAQQRVAA